MTGELTSQKEGSRGRRREGKESKGREGSPGPKGDKTTSLTPWNSVPYVSPWKATPSSCSLESYSGVGVTGIL